MRSYDQAAPGGRREARRWFPRVSFLDSVYAPYGCGPIEIFRDRYHRRSAHSYALRGGGNGPAHRPIHAIR